MEPYYLYTFESTHGAISSHKLLRSNMDAVMMPILREISASCGMSVKVSEADFEKSVQLMLGRNEKDFALYHVDGKNITPVDVEKYR